MVEALWALYHFVKTKSLLALLPIMITRSTLLLAHDKGPLGQVTHSTHLHWGQWHDLQCPRVKELPIRAHFIAYQSSTQGKQAGQPPFGRHTEVGAVGWVRSTGQFQFGMLNSWRLQILFSILSQSVLGFARPFWTEMLSINPHCKVWRQLLILPYEDIPSSVTIVWECFPPSPVSQANPRAMSRVGDSSLHSRYNSEFPFSTVPVSLEPWWIRFSL